MSVKDKEENLEVGEYNNIGSYIKHPLESVWVLWYYKNDKKNDWQENQKVIASFSTVEDFWAVYNYITAVSKISQGSDYSLFKEGIKPMWEDSENRLGGRWLINLQKNKRNTDLDNFWLETLMCLIGESFDSLSDEINGAVCSLRLRGDKLALWTRNASKEDEIKSIGKMLKSKLNTPPDVVLEYNTHESTHGKSVKVSYKL